jgi:hypothetical protein
MNRALTATVIHGPPAKNEPLPFVIEIETNPENQTATLVFSENKGRRVFPGLSAQSLLYVAKVLKQVAKNIDPDCKLVVLK